MEYLAEVQEARPDSTRSKFVRCCKSDHRCWKPQPVLEDKNIQYAEALRQRDGHSIGNAQGGEEQLTVKQYHQKYLPDIKNKKAVTLEDLLRQIRGDYEIQSRSEVESARTVWNAGGTVVKMANSLLENRVSDKPITTRIAHEYYLRNRILRRLFPEAYAGFVQKWKTENLRDLMNESKTSPTGSSYQEWTKKVHNGSFMSPKKKTDDKFGSVFKNFVDEV